MKLLTLISLLVCFSCFTSKITLSVLEPASIDLPEEIQKISIFPKPGYTPVKNKFDSLSNIQLLENSDVSQIKTGYLDGIYDVMSESPRFKKVIISDSSFGWYMKYGTLYWDDLRKLCTHDSTEHVLLLQKAIVHDAFISYTTNEDESFLRMYKVNNDTKWVFLQPFKEAVTSILSDTDSLQVYGYFDAMGAAEYLLYNNCYTSGYLTGIKICPHWKDTIRIYFDGPGLNMKRASRLIKMNNWQAASLIWNDLADGPNHSLASKAAYNMALAWEFGDDLNQSLKWIQYADSLGNKKRIKMYQKIIESRLQKNKILDKQLP
jgi:hypothetical protein